MLDSDYHKWCYLYFENPIVVCYICVGLEVHIRQKHSCNGSRVDPVSLGFAKAQVFPVQVGVQRIDDKGWQTFVKQKSENVVAVMSGTAFSSPRSVSQC